ncbi:MAG: DNA primase [Caulobacterales bacterium]|nr:DNA primase [Caulobacterales bacterium]
MSRIDDRWLEEAKGRVQLSDVIGRTVKLRKQGREHVGLSPFTAERSPSFFVNDDKGFFHDFSSGKHGDLIDFLVETERLTFREAVERLAAEAGMTLPDADPVGVEREKQRQGLTDWLELAAVWFEAELRRPAGADARAYLIRRGLPESEWARFRIGLAPTARTGLKDYLIAKGALPQALAEAGLLVSPEDGTASFDRFRDRIIFPITDARGRVVSFGGRALDPKARAKYLNGPETEVFAKSRILYGLPEARRLLQAEPTAPLVVVEGYLDTIASVRAGVAAVASMGTSLTEEHLGLLWRLHPEPTLCFDGDSAGRRAASRAIDRALPLVQSGRSLRFTSLTGGKDPDDVLRERGESALRAQLSTSAPLVEALFARERDAEPLDTPERRAGLRQRLRAAAGAIADDDLAQAYRDDLASRFASLFPRRQPGQRQQMPLGGASSTAKEAARRLMDFPRPDSAAIAVLAVEHPDWLEGRDELLAGEGFGDELLRPIADWLLAQRLGDGARARPETLLELARGVAGPGLNKDFSAWAAAFDRLVALSALDRAIREAEADAGQPAGAAALLRLQGERRQLVGRAA